MDLVQEGGKVVKKRGGKEKKNRSCCVMSSRGTRLVYIQKVDYYISTILAYMLGVYIQYIYIDTYILISVQHVYICIWEYIYIDTYILISGARCMNGIGDIYVCCLLFNIARAQGCDTRKRRANLA